MTKITIPKGLFLNTEKANCSIYESGLMAYQALKCSSRYQLDYQEINASANLVPSHYEFYLFNYHHGSMGWLNTKKLSKQLPGLKMTLVLEVLPNNPFSLCPSNDFDIYCVLDPTVKINNKRVYAFPRPLEVVDGIPSYIENKIPIIGTFGFATIGKGFELVVDAVNREFEEAIVKINIPPASHADSVCWNLYQENYSNYLTKLCKRIAKSGIQVIVTYEYMTKKELIYWCSQNTLNCFLYNRNQPGLSATTDQAISSGRPLSVSNNPTFRHIHQYIKPYPYQSLQESIELSKPQVLKIQNEWNPLNFAKQFEKVLEENLNRNYQLTRGEFIRLSVNNSLKAPYELTSKVKGKLKTVITNSFLIGSTKKAIISSSYILPTSKFSPIDNNSVSSLAMNTVLIVSHKQKSCGIHQYGINIARALQKSLHYAFIYVECSSEQELEQEILAHNPSIIIYNYYPATMPWLCSDVVKKYKVIQMGIMHEVTQEVADKADQNLFDYHLCPDPTLVVNNPFVIKVPRLIPPYINSTFSPEKPTIGSFGFGFYDKGFERLIDRVQDEFDEARIVLHIPFNEIVDSDGKYHALDTAKRCKNRLKKTGIELVVNHDFLELHELLDFLASNTLNAFFYDVTKTQGISSCIEHALAVQRPIAVTQCGMFRHMSEIFHLISIERSSLKSIINNGIAPLVNYYNEWSEDNFILSYERILNRLLYQNKLNMDDINSACAFNRILDNEARIFYKDTVKNMFTLIPELMNKKIREANVQQAFVVNTVQKFLQDFDNPKILCVGSYDDTASSALKAKGHYITEIDPVINYNLDTFCNLPSTKKQSYHIIFSTSVIEHVKNDELFIKQIVELLVPGGVAILTCDYNDQYEPGDSIPDVDHRLYTQIDFKQRLLPLLKDCHLVDEPKWDCPNPDFVYAGKYLYTFATLVFQKNYL